MGKCSSVIKKDESEKVDQLIHRVCKTQDILKGKELNVEEVSKLIDEIISDYDSDSDSSISVHEVNFYSDDESHLLEI